MATGYSQAVAIKAELIKAFTNEQHPGGKLSSVLAIGPTSYPESGVFPYVGVDIVKMKEAFIANHKIRLTIDFAISVSVRSTTLLQDAYKVRDALLDDGAGNGLQPILHNNMYLLLNGLIEKSEIGDIILLSNIDGDKGAAQTQFFADAVIMYSVNQTITV